VSASGAAENCTEYQIPVPVTNVLYVDNKRVDVYTANGSFEKPFLTVQEAVDIISGSSATNRFLINIAPGSNYNDPIVIDEINITLRGGGSISTRLAGKITVATSTLGQITFDNLILRGDFECLSSHISINVVDSNVGTGTWLFAPTTVTDDEFLQVFGGLWTSNATLTGVYVYLMGGGYYSTFTVTDKEFNINNADINDPFTALLSGTLVGSAFGNRTGNSKFTLNAGVNLTMDAGTEGGSVITIAGGTLTRSTKGTNVVNTPAGNIVATTVQAAIDELDSEKQVAGSYLVAEVDPSVDTSGEVVAIIGAGVYATDAQGALADSALQPNAVTASGTTCTITAIVDGQITGASCV
jgi:hypothetical protein